MNVKHNMKGVTMNETTSQEAALKAIHRFRTELEELLENVRKTERLMGRFGGLVEDASSAVIHDEVGDSELGPQQVVEKFLREHPGKFLTPRLIAKRIQEQGFNPKNPKFWVTQVRNCCKRAEEKHIAESKDIEGKKRYAGKQSLDMKVHEGDQETVTT